MQAVGSNLLQARQTDMPPGARQVHILQLEFRLDTCLGVSSWLPGRLQNCCCLLNSAAAAHRVSNLMLFIKRCFLLQLTLHASRALAKL